MHFKENIYIYLKGIMTEREREISYIYWLSPPRTTISLELHLGLTQGWKARQDLDLIFWCLPRHIDREGTVTLEVPVGHLAYQQEGFSEAEKGVGEI